MTKRPALCLLALLFALLTLLPAYAEPAADAPLSTVTCLADLGLLYPPPDTISGANENHQSFYRFCRTLAAQGKSDTLLLLGDLSDNASLPKETWRYGMKQISEMLADVSDTVLYTVGNTDYFAGEKDGYNSADYYATVMTDRLGKPYYWDFCYETINKVRYVTAYRYRSANVIFYFLNPTPTDMAGVLRRGNFVYTQTAMSWIETKMENDDPNGDALMFLVAHFPLEGAGNKAGALASSASERLTEICASHANLIYLSANALPFTDLQKEVTEYTDEGLVLSDAEQTGIGLSSVWTFVSAGDGAYTVKNAKTGTYLTLSDGSRLALSEEPASWYVTESNGRFFLLTSDGTTGVRRTQSGTASFTLGTATPLELYDRSTDEKGTVYTYSPTLLSGGDYVLTADSRYVLTAAGTTVTAGETRVIGDELVEVEQKTAADGTPSFTAVPVGTADTASDAVRYLTAAVYADRVEFTLHSYTAKHGIETLSTYTRPLRPAPAGRIPKEPAETIEKDSFARKTYLLVLAGAGIVGALAATAATVGIGKKRFFE